MNEGNGFFQRVGQFLSGKGYYMVLLGCLVALCFSVLYLWSALDGAEEALQPAKLFRDVPCDLIIGKIQVDQRRSIRHFRRNPSTEIVLVEINRGEILQLP